jgi:hypothetical protein
MKLASGLVAPILAACLCLPGVFGQATREPVTQRPAALSRIESLAGQWVGTGSVRALPEFPGTEAPFEGTFQWILNGYHLEGTLKYRVDGKPYEGKLLISFDLESQRYQAHWADNFSSMALTYSGSFEGESSTLVLKAVRKQGAQSVNERLRFRIRSADEWELTGSSDAGGEMRETLLVHARRKV